VFVLVCRQTDSLLSSKFPLCTHVGWLSWCPTISLLTKCMKEEVTFLALVIQGPKDPCTKINVYMQLLIEELNVLWQGVEAYDSHLNCRFNLRATYLWSIHDLLAYGIWCGWCGHDRLRCLICMSESQAYRLKHGKKEILFDVNRCFIPTNHPFRKDTKSF
jgi:hypothetical protein